jgi:L-arabinose transport system substrate-binding protein
MKASTAMKGLAAASFLIGCAGVVRADEVKLGYINKMGEHPWFVAEVAGAKEQAAKLGAKISTQDVQFNAELTLTTLDAMIGDGIKGIAIVVPDRALGPRVAEKAEKAGVKIIAVDDDIKGPNDSAVPYIGMNAGEIGAQVGREEARIFKELKWDQLKDVYLGAIEDHKADTCMRRTAGAETAFLEAVPGFDKSHIVRIPYDNTMANAIDTVTTTLTANPAAQHWIFYSCNDDGVLGAVRATENQGLKADQVIGIGIDGSRSCSVFDAGHPSGFRGTMYIDSGKEGATAVQLLEASIKQNTPLPLITYVSADLIGDSNWSQFKDKLCKK